jgi:plastocyanin
MKDNKNFGTITAVAVITAAIALLVGAIIGPATLSQTAIAAQNDSANTEGSFKSISDILTATTTSGNNAQPRVAVGGGNLSVSINQFSPSNINIQPGQNVTFYAPSGSTELHNVVFDLSNGTAISSVELGFVLPPGVSTDALQLAPPDNFGEPIIQDMSGGRQAIIALNKVLFHPSVVGQDGHATFLQEQELSQQIQQGTHQDLLNPPILSANYTIQGTDIVVSSGLILDVKGFAPLLQAQEAPQELGTAEGQQPPPTQQQEGPTSQGTEEPLPPAYPILANFTVTFNEPGAYSYFCAFHPGMDGVVNVIEADATPQGPTGA